MQLPPVRRHEPRLPQRPPPARCSDRRGRGRRAPARDLHPTHQRGAGEPAAELTVTTHMCRGNFRSSWAAEGGYDFVAEALFGELASTASSSSMTMRVRGVLSRYGSCRRASWSCSGSSPPRRVSLRTRISSSAGSRSASKFVPIDQLCLSPQCGFSSTVDGNALSYDEQIAKLELSCRSPEKFGAEVRMRAVVTEGVGAMALFDRPEPPAPGPGEVLVRPGGGRDLWLGLPLLHRRALGGGRGVPVSARARSRGGGDDHGGRGRLPSTAHGGRARGFVAAASVWALLPVLGRAPERVRQLRADRDPRRRRHAGAPGGLGESGVSDRSSTVPRWARWPSRCRSRSER